jgi:hypothetical protein
MKTFIKNLLLLGFLAIWFTPNAKAQSNTTWVTAQAIELGQEVTTVFTPDVVNELWYKVNITKGLYYEIPYSDEPFTLIPLYEGAEFNEYLELPHYYNLSYPGIRAIQFQAQENATLYIKCSYSQYYGQTLKWSIIQVTDNRVKDNAEPFELDQTITVPSGQNGRWYKTDLPSGKNYVVVGNETYRFIVYQPETTDVLAYSNKVFTTEKASTYYLCAKKSDNVETVGEVTFKMTEFPTLTNTSQEQAATLPFDQETYFAFISGNELYYKADFEAGKLYEIIAEDRTQFWNVDLYIYKNTEDDNIPTEESFSPKGNSKVFTVPETGTYYIKRKYSRTTSGDLHKMTLSEVNDRRVSSNAEEYTLGTSVSYGHKDFRMLWWKMKVDQGASYWVEFNNKDSNYDELRLYKDANGENLVQTSSESFKFTAEDNGYYYLEAYLISSYPSTPEDNSFMIQKIADNSNTSRETALQVRLDNLITANHEPESTLWYKVDLLGGHVYEVNGKMASNTSSETVEVSDAAGNVLRTEIFNNKPYLYLYPETDGTYYISWSERWVNHVLNWCISEVNDNRVQKFALPITIGEDVVTPKKNPHLNNEYWYKADFKAGKFYEVDFTQAENADVSWLIIRDEIHIYNSKGEGKGITIAKSKYLLECNEDETIYLQLTRSSSDPSSDLTWKITEQAEGDNRLCSFAQEVALDQEFTVGQNKHAPRWYKVELAEGNLYSIDWSAYGSIRENVYIYDNCGAEKELANENSEKGFSFQAKSSGTYLLSFSGAYNSEASCVIKAITDNRSCSYPVVAAENQPLSGTGITKEGLWFAMELQEDGLYEFDFTKLGHYQTGEIFTECGADKPVATGDEEKILFKAESTGTYLVHIKTSYAENDVEWQWGYNKAAEGDNRLCEYAEKIKDGEYTTNTANGKRTYWYTYDVEAGKYYQIGSDEGVYLETYKDCGDMTPTAEIHGAFLLLAENTETLYIKVNASVNSSEESTWYINETSPDGKICDSPLPVNVGERITTTMQEGIADGYSCIVWYRFVPKKSGIYEINLENFAVPCEENNNSTLDYYWAVQVYTDCSRDSMVASCGHFRDIPYASFKAYANEEYIIEALVDGAERYWSISEAKELTGSLGVVMKQADGYVLNTPDARLVLYQKINNSILVADTMKYMRGGYISGKLYQGTYLLYAENIGIGMDNKQYLPTWYTDAGVWEEATEIKLDRDQQFITLFPNAAPDDIFSGLVSISGKVVSTEGEGTDGMSDVDVCLFRQKTTEQIAPANAKAMFKAPALAGWELVARTKTDATGHYQVDNLAQGKYVVMVDMPGYTAENSGIMIDATSNDSYTDNNFEADQSTMSISYDVADAINNANVSDLKIYPNPFKDNIVIENAKDARLQIYTVNGACVFAKPLANDRETLKLQHLSAGVYIFNIVKDNKTLSTVMIKK